MHVLWSKVIEITLLFKTIILINQKCIYELELWRVKRYQKYCHFLQVVLEILELYILRPFLIIIISITKIITWTRHMCHFFWTLFYDISVYKEPRDVTLTIVHYWCSSGQLAKVRYSKCKFSETNFILPSFLNKKSKFSKFEKEKKENTKEKCI